MAEQTVLNVSTVQRISVLTESDTVEVHAIDKDKRSVVLIFSDEYFGQFLAGAVRCYGDAHDSQKKPRR